MATFPYSPDWGATPDLQPRVLQAKFDDGYDQRAADGLNDLLATWKLTFSRRTQAEATAIAAWFARHRAHVTAFDWAGPFGGATAEQFGTGDGVTKNWALTGAGIPVSTATVTSIWRNDWQGNQLLYSVSRSNAALYSEQFDNAAWTKFNSTILANVSVAPDGTSTMDAVVENATNALHGVSQTYSAVAGQKICLSYFVKPNTRTKCSLVINYSDGGYQQAYFDVAGASVTSNTSAGGAALGVASISYVGVFSGLPVYRVSLAGVASASGATSIEFRLCDSSGNQTYAGVGSDMHIWGGQIEPNQTYASGPTSYIGPTTTAAVAVTDYTVSGVSVSFGVAPASGAVLTWSGSYTFKFVAVKWTQPRPNDFNSWSVTAEFRQVPA